MKFVSAKHSLLIFLFNILSSPSLAHVDVRDGSYQHQKIDPIGHSSFELKRTYNSRSLFRGLFGLGWCSDIDEKLSIENEQHILFNHCHYGELSFTRIEGTENTFINSQIENAQIIKEEDNYYYVSGGEVLIIFDILGRIVGYQKGEDNSYKVNYNRHGSIQSITHSTGQVAQVHLNPSPAYIVRIINQDGHDLRYNYQNLNLISVLINTPRNNDELTYKYDKLHNLTEIELNTKLVSQIKYDAERDLAIFHRDFPECALKFSYETNADKFQLLTQTRVRKLCGNQTETEIRYEFTYLTHEVTHQKYLDLMTVATSDVLLEVKLHPKIGEPIFVRKNSKVKKFETAASRLPAQDYEINNIKNLSPQPAPRTSLARALKVLGDFFDYLKFRTFTGE